MNCSENKEQEVNKKSYSCPQGPLAWLNLIEIGKISYLIAFLLLSLSIVLLHQPMFSIDLPYGEAMPYALHEVEELKGLGICAIILNIVSFVSLLVPIVKFFEWKYVWFAPIAVTSLIDIIGVCYLIGKKNELIQDTLLGYAYELLAIEINITGSAWILLVVNVAMLLCAVKMMFDIKQNQIKYDGH